MKGDALAQSCVSPNTADPKYQELILTSLVIIILLYVVQLCTRLDRNLDIITLLYKFLSCAHAFI